MGIDILDNGQKTNDMVRGDIVTKRQGKNTQGTGPKGKEKDRENTST